MYPTDPILAICWRRFLVKASGIAAVALALTAVFAGGGALAQSGYDEADAQAIDRMLMCPVCPAQTIDQTEVPLAKQMRAQVRELLAAGATRSETLNWFRERYGPGIVAEPPRSGLNLIAWIVPGVVIVLALAGGAFVLRAMRRPDDVSAVSDTDTGMNAYGESDNLQPWLDAVDRELGRNGRRDPGPEKDDGNNG